MDGFKETIAEFAELMVEYRLSEAKLKGDDWKIAFGKARLVPIQAETVVYEEVHSGAHAPAPGAPQTVAAPAGTPVSSPMTGIYYAAPSPSAPPFVKEGENVTAGQVVGLIEAMKVFNEIVAPVSGRVDRVVADSGALVQPGEPILYIV